VERNFTIAACLWQSENETRDWRFKWENIRYSAILSNSAATLAPERSAGENLPISGGIVLS
jgi:hypothetical protein